MTEHYGQRSAPGDTLDTIQAESAQLYGEEAQFAYPLSSGQYAILSLSEVTAICGDHIKAEKDVDILRLMLREFYDNAQKILDSNNPRLIESSRLLGKQALERRAIG